MAITASGIGSNLDIDGIVSQLMSLERQPLSALARKEATYQAKLSAYGSLNGALSQVQSAIGSLANTNLVVSYQANSSNSSAFTASATSSAALSSYQVDISQLAQAQRLATAGVANQADAIGQGSISFQFGTISGGTLDAGTGKYTGASFTPSGGVGNVTIEPGKTSLTDIRDAINAAGVGVTANIVNVGGATPYRLALTSTQTGEAYGMKVSVTGDAALQNLLAHDPAADLGQAMSQTSKAQDAKLKIDGLEVSSSTNVFANNIPGVTITAAAVTTTTATLGVTKSTSSIAPTINGFISAYNQAVATFKDLGKFDSKTGEKGPLLGDSALRSAQNQLRAVLNTRLDDVGTFSTLSELGVAVQKDGTLALNTTKLQAAIDKDVNGVLSLLGAFGSASDPDVTFVAAGTKTQPGSYAVNITQAATQGVVAGSAAAGLTITAGVNDTLDLLVNGKAASVSLAAGTYASAGDLATELQKRINAAPELAKASLAVTVSANAGVLSILSNSWGASSSVAISGGNGADDLLGAGRTSTDGQDVAGTVGGQAMLGSGRTLTGANSSILEGLKIEIGGTSTGDRGTIKVTQGYAFQFDKVLGSMVGSNGMVAAKSSGLSASIQDIDRQRQTLNRRLEDIQARYRAQFTALDVSISQMNSLSSYLAQQLASLPGSASSR